MNNTKKLYLIAICLFVMAIGVWMWNKVEDSPDDIRVGFMRIAAHLPVVAAVEEGLFENNFNLNVKLEVFGDTPSLMRALEEDKIDVAFQVTPDSAWKASSRGKQYFVYFVAQSTSSSPIDGLYALPTDKTRNFRGSKIGVFPGPTASAMIKTIMYKAYSLKEDQYSLSQIPPPLQLNLLSNGEIDALFTYEPLGQLALERIGAELLIKAPVEQYVVDPWNGGIGIFAESIVTYRPNVACRFSSAIANMVDRLNANKELSAEYMVDLQPGLSIEIARKIPFTTYYFASGKDIPKSLTRSSGELAEMLSKQLTVYAGLGILENGKGYNLPILDVCQ